MKKLPNKHENIPIQYFSNPQQQFKVASAFIQKITDGPET